MIGINTCNKLQPELLYLIINYVLTQDKKMTNEVHLIYIFLHIYKFKHNLESSIDRITACSLFQCLYELITNQKK